MSKLILGGDSIRLANEKLVSDYQVIQKGTMVAAPKGQLVVTSGNTLVLADDNTAKGDSVFLSDNDWDAATGRTRGTGFYELLPLRVTDNDLFNFRITTKTKFFNPLTDIDLECGLTADGRELDKTNVTDPLVKIKSITTDGDVQNVYFYAL